MITELELSVSCIKAWKLKAIFLKSQVGVGSFFAHPTDCININENNSMGRADSERSDNPPMPNNVKFPDMPPNKNPIFGYVGVEASMIGFVYGGSLKRNHPTIHPPYGRYNSPAVWSFKHLVISTKGRNLCNAQHP